MSIRDWLFSDRETRHITERTRPPAGAAPRSRNSAEIMEAALVALYERERIMADICPVRPYKKGFCPRCGCPGDSSHLWRYEYKDASDGRGEYLVLTCKSCGYSMELPCCPEEDD